MGTQNFRLQRDDRVAESSQVLDGRINKIIREQLLPRVAERNRIAVQGQRVRFFLFNKLTQGRRCSCFKIETSSDQQCLGCFGTGIVGGYEKYGTLLNVFDVTHPSVVAVNVRPNYQYLGGMKPINWSLIKTATSGYVATKIPLKTNLGRVDSFKAVHTQVPGGLIRYWIKAPSDTDFVPLNSTNDVAVRLGNPYVIIKVDLKRATTSNDSPLFSLIYLRYQIKKKLLVDCDVPKTERQHLWGEFGVDDSWQRQSFWLTNVVRQINPGDFLCSTSGTERWKIYGATEVAPTDFLTSWDLQTRLIKTNSEAKARVPVGGLGITDELELKKGMRTHDPNY